MSRIAQVIKRNFSVYAYRGVKPTICPTSYVAKNATVIGNVEIKGNVAVLFNSVVRADNDKITIGANSNIQDGCILHTDDGIQLTLGDNVSVGHLATLHGCTIGDNTIVGMGATIMNRAVVGKNCIIGANALILEGKVIPDNSIVVGSPAKVVRETTEKDHAMITNTAKNYYTKIPFFKEMEATGEQ